MDHIKTSSVSLDTLSVTIRALHVDNKQMTIAVFRQLPYGEEPLDTDTLWGIVRCLITEDQEQCDTWLVYSSGETLYRYPAVAPWPIRGVPFLGEREWRISLNKQGQKWMSTLPQLFIAV